jgi:hypothetical protein
LKAAAERYRIRDHRLFKDGDVPPRRVVIVTGASRCIGAAIARLATTRSFMNPSSESTYDALWPRSPRHDRASAPKFAARSPSLDGKVVGLVWDYVFRGDEVFAALEAGLRARFPDIRFVHWSEFGNTHGSDERQVVANLPKRLHELEVDAVISAMAA